MSTFRGKESSLPYRFQRGQVRENLTAPKQPALVLLKERKMRSAAGLAPDVYVAADLADEQVVLFNAATNVTLTVSLQPTPIKKRMSEADLVKAFKGEAVETIGLSPAPDHEAGAADGQDAGADTTGDEEGPSAVSDVVLQRAVDIMKGIRVLLSWR